MNNMYINGFYENAFEWINEAISDKTLIANYYKEFYSSEIISFPPPNGIDPPRWGLKQHFRKPYVAVLPYGSILGERSFVITPNNKILRDMTLEPELLSIYANKKLPPVNYLHETVATVGWWPTQTNYGHWFIDILPRIDLLRKSGLKIDKYVFGKLLLPFQFESLNKLGIPFEKIIQIDNDQFYLKANQLVVPSIPGAIGTCPKWACDFLKSNIFTVETNDKMENFDKIYISREDYGTRNVINQDQVINFLLTKGFKKVILTPLTFREKMNIFSSAKVIISPVGAGLTNLLFCKPGTILIELSGYRMACDIYWKMSNYYNLRYYHLICDIVAPPKSNPGLDDIIVNIDKLNTIMNIAGI
jgi:hypothetical protein